MAQTGLTAAEAGASEPSMPMPDLSVYKEQLLRRLAAGGDADAAAAGGTVTASAARGVPGSAAGSVDTAAGAGAAGGAWSAGSLLQGPGAGYGSDAAAALMEFEADDVPVPMETEVGDDRDADAAKSHRANFASQAAGALVVAANPEATGVGSLLTSDADSYALSRCDVKKWVIIGLSEDVLVDALVVSNEEKYSSAVHHFRVVGSQKYPASEWIVLGNFTADNVLGEQTFNVSVRTWVRYIRITWLSHYGSEFYCTWTRVKVHGSTMLEDLQQHVFSSEAEVNTVRLQLEKGSGASAAAGGPAAGANGSAGVPLMHAGTAAAAGATATRTA
jgi:hypothetical protein